MFDPNYTKKDTTAETSRSAAASGSTAGIVSPQSVMLYDRVSTNVCAKTDREVYLQTSPDFAVKNDNEIIH